MGGGGEYRRRTETETDRDTAHRHGLKEVAVGLCFV